MVSTVKQVAGDDPGGLLAQERPPRGGHPPWRGPAMAAQGGADHRRRDGHAKAEQLPWMCWSPQRGFSLARRTISCCSSWSSGGRPGPRCGEVQAPATSRRCQPSSVGGAPSAARRRRRVGRGPGGPASGRTGVGVEHGRGAAASQGLDGRLRSASPGRDPALDNAGEPEVAELAVPCGRSHPMPPMPRGRRFTLRYATRATPATTRASHCCW